MPSSSTLKEIYTSLLAGNKLSIPFFSTSDFKAFRTTLHRYKTAQDDVWSVMDIPKNHSLKSTFDPVSCSAVFEFIKLQDEKRFEFTIIKEGTE